MKKIYSLFISFAISTSVFSQALPNPGFDNWTNHGTYDDPDNWNTLNSATSGFGVLTCLKATGADVRTGSAALKLITQWVLIQNANGIATTGNVNVAQQTIDGGIPYTLRPDSVTGWFKCDPQGNDFGFVDFSLTDGGNPEDTIGYAHFQTPNAAVTTYTYFSVPVNYYNGNTPAISRFVLSSSAGYTSVLNSVLFIDDLELVFNSTGIREPVFTEQPVRYNASGQLIEISASENSILAVFDITGKMVFSSKADSGKTEFSFGNFTPGLYLYRLIGNDSGRLVSGKFIAN